MSDDFAGIVERPYGATGLTTARWRAEVPLVRVLFCDLWLTQTGVRIKPLLRPCSCDDDSQAPLAVRYEGQIFLEDGHHRVLRHAIAHQGIAMTMHLFTMERP